MRDIAKFVGETVQELDKLKGVKIERAKLGPCPICGREITENRKGYSCWSREDPGCGFVIWKKKAGKKLPVSVAKELIESLSSSREAGEEPGVGRTAKAVTGFRGRSGRTFRAKLRLEQVEEGKWRVEFDEEWAKEPPKGEAEEERAEAEAAAALRGGWRAARSIARPRSLALRARSLARMRLALTCSAAGDVARVPPSRAAWEIASLCSLGAYRPHNCTMNGPLGCLVPTRARLVAVGRAARSIARPRSLALRARSLARKRLALTCSAAGNVARGPPSREASVSVRRREKVELAMPAGRGVLCTILPEGTSTTRSACSPIA